MKRQSKIISVVLALVMLVSVFAVMSTSFAADTSSKAVFRVEGKKVGYNTLNVSVYAPAGVAGGSYTLTYNTEKLEVVKPAADANGDQTSSVPLSNGGSALTNFNFLDNAIRCVSAAAYNLLSEQAYGEYTFIVKDETEGTDAYDISITSYDLFNENSASLGSDATGAICKYNLSEADWNTLTLKNVNGTWLYMENGVNNTSYVGLTNYYGTWYYVANGSVDWSYTGLTRLGTTWYYVAGGVLDWGYTGITKLGTTWYYVANGVLDWSYTGITNYYGTWYYISGGTLDWGYTGLTKYYGTWYYINNGVLDWGYTGYTTYYGTRYYVKNGVLA